MLSFVDMALSRTLSQGSNVLFVAHFTASQCVAVERTLEIEESPDFFYTGHLSSFHGKLLGCREDEPILVGRCADGVSLPRHNPLYFFCGSSSLSPFLKTP